MIFLFRIISDENPDFFRDLVEGAQIPFWIFTILFKRSWAMMPPSLLPFLLRMQIGRKSRKLP